MGNCLPSRGSGRVSEEFAGSGIMRVSKEFAGRKEFSVQYVQDGSGIMRVKMVISKRELEALLSEFSVQYVQDGSGIMRVKMVISKRELEALLSEFSVQYVQDGSGIMRVKMVISKPELEAFLSHRCMKEKLLLPQLKSIVATERYDATRRCRSGGWRPSLEGVPELN